MRFLAQSLLFAGFLVSTVTCEALASAPVSSWADVVAKAQSRISHVVVLMMENRSFDHLLGWLHTDKDARIDGIKDGMQVPRGRSAIHICHSQPRLIN